MVFNSSTKEVSVIIEKFLFYLHNCKIISGTVVDILRICATDFGEDWLTYDNVCSYDILRGGKNEVCFCEGDYCNENNDNITSICDKPSKHDPISFEGNIFYVKQQIDL